MIDFLMISTRSKKNGLIEIYPKFIIKKSSDLMIRGGDFYAIWIEERGLWSTDEQDALQLIDRELDRYAEENRNRFDSNVKVLHMWDSESGMIDSWHKYCQKQMRDSFHMLDEKLIFSNTPTNKKDYASKRLGYPLEAGETPAYDKLMSTLYEEEERRKIEWAIGSIISGESKKLQKFMVLYGAAGTGKSTVLNIIQQLFEGYYSVFDAKALGSSSNAFALEAFKDNPLVAIQHDGDLSKIEDNTRLNSLVSHERMTVNEKFKSTYSNSFKCFLFMGTNKPVKITDAKSGLIRRLIDVSPSGEKLSPKEYKHAVKQVGFELGPIAHHCQEVYLSEPGRYDDYIPIILPVTDMKDDEVYAPNYKNGEKVALIRYPHGGTFEIPILTVNNKQSTAKRMLDNALDAIGINSKVAERLSGADFDGDTVMVIPTGGKVKVTSTPPLKGLEGFDPKLEYGGKKEGTFKPMKNTQTEMGKISNLITDMTLKGATQDELARAVRHSMVVIDAEKHKLDYKQSERDNGISALKKKYQGTVDENGRYHEGAATLISRAKSETSVLKRKGSPIIDKETGEQRYKEVYEEYTDKNGKVKVRTQASTKMAETKDARTLSSGTPQEEAYADYANNMKSLANRARREMMNTGKIAYSASAKRTYQAEVDSLEAKLNVALKNAPRERQAQILANAAVKAKKQENPDMTKGEIKKANQQALTAARNSVGAKREPILITDREWEAIQAGAISENRLTQIINNVDTDKLRQRATPRATTTLSSAKVNKISSMNASGYTTAEIAEALGVSASTVSKYLN